jgi:hypothetical protein
MLSTLRKGVENPQLVLHFIRTNLLWRWYLLESDSYTDAYKKMKAFQVDAVGPREAIGGEDLGIGKLQFKFLKEQGLEPTNFLLDIGCGSLRGGQYYIDYLNPSRYTGMDISEEVIESGKELVGESEISQNSPSFIVNDDLRFEEVNQKFDYIIAQSVFTHLPEQDIVECFNYVHKALKEDGLFFATFFDDDDHKSPRNFIYDADHLMSLAENSGLSASLLSQDDYPHPRGQRMLRITQS